MNKTSILIVDDQDLFAKGLQLVIEGEGKGEIKVLGIAKDGYEAIEYTERLNPDIILMDIRMPRMDGVEATKIIIEKHPGIKIMILTTFDDDEYAYNALSAGAMGFILKSVQPEELVLAIGAVKNNALYVSSSVGFKLVEKMKPLQLIETGKELNLIDAILLKIQSLTLREAEVLKAVVQGKRNNEISDELCLSEKTVKNYLSSIYEKLDIHNRLQVINYVNNLVRKK
jgi:DNA-binding NarL/FixJ family response regulator